MHYLELLERAHNGEKIEKEQWDVEYIVIKTMELISKYDLKFDNNTIIPTDDTLIENTFKAAKELISEIGVYYLSEGRRIYLTEEEIDEALKNAKQEILMGEGKDAVTLYARKPEDTRYPLVWAGNPGCPTPEDIFKPTVKSWAKEEVVDLITCGSLTTVDGYPVRKHEASELLAVRRELDLLRSATREVGRPGMGMLAAESAVSEIGDLAAVGSDRLRPCDSHLTVMLNELVIDRDNMVRTASSIDYGMRNAGLTCTMVGGLGGDAAGSALLMIASIMAANILCRADYHLCHPIDLRHVATSTRGSMYVHSMACQAYANHAPNIIFCDIYPKSGALTKELLYEVAANAITATVSGGHLEGVGAADGLVPHGTGLEVRLMGEVGRAVVDNRLTRETANEIVLKLLDKYEHVFSLEGGNPGKPFNEAYDMDKIEPVEEWVNMYEEVKKELNEMGLNI